MVRVAAIAMLCSLLPALGVAAPAGADRKSQMTASVVIVSACNASAPGVVAAADPTELRLALRVSCPETVAYRVKVLGGAAPAAPEPATAPLILSVEF
jgi:hypothetical protein